LTGFAYYFGSTKIIFFSLLLGFPAKKYFLAWFFRKMFFKFVVRKTVLTLTIRI